MNELNSLKVFISYAREDFSFANKLYNDLKLSKVKPWIDTKDILPGENWQKAISKAIKESAFFIILLSSNSISKKGYIQKELKVALDLLNQLPDSEIFIIPIRIDDCSPINEQLQNLHYADFFSSYEDGLQKILRVINGSDDIPVSTIKKKNQIDFNLSQINSQLMTVQSKSKKKDSLYQTEQIVSRQLYNDDKKLQTVQNFIQFFTQTLKNTLLRFFSILLSPRNFFNSIEHDKIDELVNALLFIVFLSIIGLLIYSPIYLIMGIKVLNFSYLLTDTILTLIFCFVVGTIFHLFAKLFGGKGSFNSSIVIFLYLLSLSPIIQILSLPVEKVMRQMIFDKPINIKFYMQASSIIFDSPVLIISAIMQFIGYLFWGVYAIIGFKIIHQVGTTRCFFIVLFGCNVWQFFSCFIVIPILQILFHAYK